MNLVKGYILKADIKHYFQKVNHNILINIIKRKIKDEKVIWLIKKILENFPKEGEAHIGIPLGNYTSQFFANLYLNELDQFIKNKLKVRYYIRYVDDFVIFHKSKQTLKEYKIKIQKFLKDNLNLELHKDKSRIISLYKGIGFLGFRIFQKHILLRKRNIENMKNKIKKYKKGDTPKQKLFEIYQGWKVYSKWANSSNVRIEILKLINKI